MEMRTPHAGRDGPRHDRDGEVGPWCSPHRSALLQRRRVSIYVHSLRERLAEFGATPSIGTVGDSYADALAETVNGYYKTELVRGPARTGSWRTVEDLELVTLGCVRWYNTQRLHGYLGDIPPEDLEKTFYADQTTSNQPVGIK